MLPLFGLGRQMVCAAPRTHLRFCGLLSSRFIHRSRRKFYLQSAVATPRSQYSDGVVSCVAAEGRQVVGSPGLVALEYSELNLSDKASEELGLIRIRQHVNPLKSSFSVPAPVPDWTEIFEDSTLPLMVDIGSGSGRFLMWLAKRNPRSRNYLGMEIREKLVKRAEYWANEIALANIHFMYANATISFKKIVSTYPGPLMLVSILCPDPHFKNRHHKRRVLQDHLVESIVDSLVPGGEVFIQSDVLEVALDMRYKFDSVGDRLRPINEINNDMVCDEDGWLLKNPMGIRTEREIHAESEGASIYRRVYQKLA